MFVERYLSQSIGTTPSTITSPNFSGKWRNRLDSEMELTVHIDGDVIGKYRTGVGKPKPTEEFDLKGFVSGDLIVFCVNFGKYASLTSWAGQHTLDDKGDEIIYTLWHLAKNISDVDEPDKLWSGMLTGANEYKRET